MPSLLLPSSLHPPPSSPLPPPLRPPSSPSSPSQYTRLSQCVQAAGATCCRSPASNPSPLESLATEESIVLAVEDEALQLLGPEEQEWVVQVTSYLTRCVVCPTPPKYLRKEIPCFLLSLRLTHTHNSQNLRPILDSEIGFALLHISTNSYCNPQSTEGELIPDHNKDSQRYL